LSQDYSDRLQKLQAVADIGFSQPIKRGIEREALRIQSNGQLVTTPHPSALGSALTHPLITTDYAESLLEFITPVSENMDELFDALQDVHKAAIDELGGERLWPMSMPCYVRDANEIELAQYGTSNVGRMKTLYREGLRSRYGSTMQIIAGVHYNFSLPMSFWKIWQQIVGDSQPLDAFISEQYMALIRNYYRFGWLIPYWFGASPALCRSFLQGLESTLRFESLGKGSIYLPYATSLRMSDLGYTSSAQSSLSISYNSLSEYVASVREATLTHSPEFARIGVKCDGAYRQLNDNILQIENELYAPIRAKRVARSGQTPSQALEQAGIEYIEIRALDVNPFVAEGVSPSQLHVIDALLLWCLVTPSKPMSPMELQQNRANFGQVAVNGRDPKQTLSILGQTQPVMDWVTSVMSEMADFAALLGDEVQTSLSELGQQVKEGQTLSARILNGLLSQDMDNGHLALELSRLHYEQLKTHQFKRWQPEAFKEMAKVSIAEQQAIEAADTQGLDDYLVDYFVRAQQPG
jgi:glutamate--cysteine ligase